MSAFFSLISDYRSWKILLFTVWLVITFRINVFWLLEQKRRNTLLLVIDQLSYMNIFVTIMCMEVELLWTILIEWSFGDLLCRITKWLQTTTLILSSAFILQIVIFLKYPEKSIKRVKQNIFMFWLTGLFLASPQLLIFGSYNVTPNNLTQCTVEQDVPESYEEIQYLKMTWFAIPVINLLTAHSFLFCIFMGQKKPNSEQFWRKHAKDKWRIMKIYLMMVYCTYCAFFALSVCSMYFEQMGIIVEYFHYGLLQAGCIFSTFNPFLLRKILEISASDEAHDGISSSSSSPPPFNLFPIELSDDPQTSSFDSVSVPLRDDNDGISSLSSSSSPPPPFNLVSIHLSDDPPTPSLDSVSIPLSDNNDGISSSSLSSSPRPPFNLFSIQLNDDPPTSSFDSVLVPLSDDKDGISSSPPLNSVSFQLSDDLPSLSLDSVSVPLSDGNDGNSSSSSSLNTVPIVLSGVENVAPDKERKRNTRHLKKAFNCT